MSDSSPHSDPNESNKVRVLGGGIYLDSPTHTHGVSVKAKQDEGWLKIDVEADESIIGWALTFNGRDIPIYVEREGA